jgi:pyruvate/2-oxoglutarate dehydrogenase complex dihydrolipoamide dehydrogenase (E3) component
MRIAIIGGGPGGYEAALVAAELGAQVTVIDRAGLGGACVLWDCVPSKTLCSTAEVVTWMEAAPSLGLTRDPTPLDVDLSKVFERVLFLATAQSRDVEKKVEQAGVRTVRANGRFLDARTIETTADDGTIERIEAEAVLIATGSSPRELATAVPDGARILNGRQVYNLTEIPERLIVVGSGATGAEFTHAFNRLGAHVTLVSSRQHVLPSEDIDAAEVLEEVFTRRGVEILRDTRAVAARATGDGVEVELEGGRTLQGSHALFTVGQVPNSADLGLEAAGVRVNADGMIPVDGVSRTNVPHIYAAGDVTGGMMLASVAAMEGRIAMWHALGQAVTPFRPEEIASTVFTDPEIATAGLGEKTARERGLAIDVMKLPFATNARAKMVGLEDGFVKLVVAAHSRIVVGGTIVSPHASDLILPVSVAVHARLHVAQLAQAFSIYPSFGGSVQEAARRLMG